MAIVMRPSKSLALLRAGQVVKVTKLNLADPAVCEIAGLCGIDCAWTDMEHVPNTLTDIKNQVRAAKMVGIDTLVRVQRGSYSDLIHPLEMDATGVMVPHVMSVEDAERVAWYTRFAPIGRRPFDGGNSDGGYCLIDPEEYAAQANQQRMVVVQIEDPEPLEHVERIAAIEGIDMLFFGPGDFSQGIGATGRFDDPRIDQARRRVAKAATDAGKFAGTTGSPAMVDDLIGMGYRFISLGADVVALSGYFKQMVEAFGGTSASVSEERLV